jgi:GT2 family glycosyltransferase
MTRVSVVIPYFRRLGNLRLALFALAEQDLPREEFEVVVGSLENSVELTALLQQFEDRLQIRCICAAEPWNVARARNLALRAVEGEIVQLLDADMLLPRAYLRRLVQRFSSDAQVVVGQMLNYDEGVDVGSYAEHDFEFYRQRFLAHEECTGLPADIRWTIERPLPWALCWTASIALRRRDLEQSALFFDTRFKGWGVEDTEWAFRLAQANLSIAFADELWAIHLPHPRNVASNHRDEAANFDRFLRKWPCFDVEVVAAFGDIGGNRRYRELQLEAERVTGTTGRFGVVEYPAADGAALAIGAVRGDDGRLANPELGATALQTAGWKLLPVLGFRLPYDTGSVARAEVLPTLRRMPADLQEIVRREAQRVSRSPIHVH